MSFYNPFDSASDSTVSGLGYNSFTVALNYISGIPDANIVPDASLKLIFKSLLKRDDTTKEKALNELDSYINRESNTSSLRDDLVLITWIQLYPKLSISESKNVRALAHQVHISLIGKLQKSIAKYLKDSVPVLLSGLYDTDSYVSNSTLKNLRKIFNNDQNKINNLWLNFQPEILNFANESLNNETVDSLSDDRYVSRNEALTKYSRLINSTILMITHLIQLCCPKDGELNSKFAENFERYQDFFKYENLWHYLLINSNSNSQRIYKTILNLLNSALNLKIDLITETAWKFLTRRFLKSLTFVKNVDLNGQGYVLYSSLIIPIISTLQNLNSKRPDFYEFEKSSKEKLFAFLKIGSLNSDASYYKVLSKFIIDNSICSIDQDFDELEAILHSDFQLEISRNSKLRAGGAFIENSLAAYLEVITKSTNKEKVSNSLISIFDEVLNVEREQLAKPLVALLSKVLSPTFVEARLKEFTPDTLLSFAPQKLKNLVGIAQLSSAPLDTLLSSSLESLRVHAEESEDRISENPAFFIFESVIRSNSEKYKSIIEEFIDDLASFITSNFILKPITLLADYSKTTFLNEKLFFEAFDNFIIKLTFIEKEALIFTKLDSFKNRDDLLKNSDELRTLIKNYSTTYDFGDDSLFKPYLLDEDVVFNLLNTSEEKGLFGKFLEYYWKYNKDDVDLLKKLVTKTNFLNKGIWQFFKKDVHLKLLFLLSDESKISDYFDSLKSYIYEFESSSEVKDYVSEILSSNASYLNYVMGEEYINEVFTIYGDVIDSRLSIGNPLEANIYLLNLKDSSFNFNLLKYIKFGKFLSELDVEFADTQLINLAILGEIGVDFQFLTTDENNATNFLDFSKSTITKVVSKFDSFDHVFNEIASENYTSVIVKLLFEKTTSTVSTFYNCRILKSILTTLVQYETKAKFLKLPVEQYVKKNIRQLRPLSLLQFTTVISSLAKFLALEEFERLRNLVGSELIGTKPSEINSHGLYKLIILNNFIRFDTDDRDVLPLQFQRFNMITVELNKWLESDSAYEDEFVFVRIGLLDFLNKVNYLTFEKSETFKDLTIRVLEDSLGLISIGEGSSLLELEYFSLKLYLTLEKQGLLGESKQGLEDQVLELFLSIRNDAGKNQPIMNNLDNLSRILQKIDISRFEQNYDNILDAYGKVSNFGLKRILLSILTKLTLKKQQTQVIEFELSKNDDKSEFKLSQVLVDGVLNVPQLDHSGDAVEEDKKLISYLWNWKLLLSNFKDITLRLRSILITQLQSENNELIYKILNVISIIIYEINDKSFLDKIEKDKLLYIDYEYENFDEEDDEESLQYEIKILSIHLYYSVLTLIGGVSSSWFHDLKDRNFKSKIENFTIKFISPTLIAGKLNLFELKIDQLTSKDENLSIKINRISNEIKSTYLIDDQNLEVVFKIPSNYPMSNVEINGTQRVGVKEQQWKSWILASQRIISLQNGEIYESLELFLKNVALHFKGFEECAICYSILHQDNSLPSKTCHTCKNKFHAGCLYKWFKSSGGNTCPLCRSPFDFK